MKKTNEKQRKIQSLCLAMAIMLTANLIYGDVFKGKSTEVYSGNSDVLGGKNINNIDNTKPSKELEKAQPIQEEKSSVSDEDKIRRLIKDDKDNILRLVNEDNKVDDKDLRNSLVVPNVSLVDTGKNEKNLLRKEAASALENMLLDAKNNKLTIYLSSGYRSKERQIQVYNAKVYNSGNKEQAFVAKPGHSEHQTGLAVDLTSKSVKFKLIQDFQYTAEGKWLYENAHKYGFILRYPKNKKDETGYAFEPWHFRYVGVEVSTYMKKHNLTLEKLYEKLNL
ncbi:MAG: M15 family metallopeptidase [Clostridium sp.]|uniref:M15 family metallopeptidase n=1 Tax=Clostridium sp. TaxID=1506 RepID=UPI002FC75A54